MTNLWRPRVRTRFAATAGPVQDAVLDVQTFLISTHAAAAGMVEAWLQRLVEGMQGTMKTLIRRAARSVNEMGLQDFLFGHPAQIALLGLQFQWTADTQARCIFGSCRHYLGICFERQLYCKASPSRCHLLNGACTA